MILLSKKHSYEEKQSIYLLLNTSFKRLQIFGGYELLQGISFQEFKQFCQFMNSIDDFTIAMNMYTYANRPVSRGEYVGQNKSHLVGKPTMWFPNRSDTNRPVLSQKMARSLKFWSYVEEELYYLSSENKGADQLSAYADCWFSHGAAHNLSFRLSFPAGILVEMQKLCEQTSTIQYLWQYFF